VKTSIAHFIPGVLAATAAGALAGPYSLALNDPLSATDAPVPGFAGPHGIGKARLLIGLDENEQPIYQNPDNHLHPLFFAWAETVSEYLRSDTATPFNDPTLALGPVTGDVFDVVALGELNATAIANGDPAGSITLELARPVRNLSGADFVIFENGVIAQTNYGGAGIGGIFGELAHVEVSADGVDFVRFPSRSLTASAVGGYGSIDPTNVRNLAGKHVNGYGESWGTPFDLTEVGLSEIRHVRLIDVPGDGSFTDSTGYPIRDPWVTFGSGGFDLEAVGAISSPMTYAEWPQLELLDAGDRDPMDDPDGDGVCNLLEYAAATLPWKADASGTFITLIDGQPAITFIRDERLTDLVIEVQSSPAMEANTWTTLATSTAGAAFQAAPGKSPAITEVSASDVASVGVIRRTTLRDTTAPPGRGFLRVKVTRLPLTNPE
jgi:hypothetical protein